MFLVIKHTAYQSCWRESKIWAYDFSSIFPESTFLVIRVEICQLSPRLPNHSDCFSRNFIWRNFMAQSMIRMAACGSSDFSASCFASSWFFEHTMCAFHSTWCLTEHGQSRKANLLVFRNYKASMMTLQSLVSLPSEHSSALGIARKSIDADADKDAGAQY